MNYHIKGICVNYVRDCIGGNDECKYINCIGYYKMVIVVYYKYGECINYFEDFKNSECINWVSYREVDYIRDYKSFYKMSYVIWYERGGYMNYEADYRCELY